MIRIGLFGGTFDPVHRGHIELSRSAMEVCKLDKVVFIPAAAPPHKENISITSFEHRVAMLKLAISGEEDLSISKIEENLASPSFTIDTLRMFFEKQKGSNDYFFIIGIDAFLEIHTWKEYENVLNCVNFIVSAREGYHSDLFYMYMTNLCYSRNGSFWYNSNNGRKIFYLKIGIPDISSSNVRESIQREKVSGDMIHSEVLQYIKEFGLYA